MTNDDRSTLFALIRRDLAVGLVVALLLWGLVNVGISLSASRETYSACNSDHSICVKRHESWHVPGFRRVDHIRIGDRSGTCGEDHLTPFAPKGKPLFRDGAVTLRGSDGTTATYLAGVC